jgi:hypothetical protein
MLTFALHLLTFTSCCCCRCTARYFTHQELHELFKWDPAALAVSETQQLLKQQHMPSDDLAAIASHVAWLEAHTLCAGALASSLMAF